MDDGAHQERLPLEALAYSGCDALRQHLEIPGVWLERGTIAADRTEAALEAARAAIEASPLRLQAGATQPHPQVIVLRVLAPVGEPAMQLLRPVWAAWREGLWGLAGTVPRLWNL
jgi:urease accessory protein